MFHRPRDEESANAKNLQNIIPHTGYGAVNLETRETVCCCVRAESAAPRTGRCNVATFSSSSFGKMQTLNSSSCPQQLAKGTPQRQETHRIPCRNSRYQGLRNVIAVADCRCHSWHKGRCGVLRDKEPKSQNTEIATTKLHDIVQNCLCSSCVVRGWPGGAI